MTRLILLRHGQSEWNKKNIFTGWVDIPLSAAGIEESLQAGEKIKDISIDLVYTSTLIRGIMTACLVMSKHNSGKVLLFEHKEGQLHKWGKCQDRGLQTTLPAVMAWELNERIYGELQGQNKDEMRKKYGKEQVELWRRSFDQMPPNGESLQMTCARTLPFFKNQVFPNIRNGKNVFISAHGNSLRSIVMELEQLSEKEVISLEIPTAVPLIYHYREGRWRKDDLFR